MPLIVAVNWRAPVYRRGIERASGRAQLAVRRNDGPHRHSYDGGASIQMVTA